MLPDLVNGLYEGIGGFMCLLNVRALYRDKKISGIRLLPSVFFMTWGFWNLYYYPHLGQWLSFSGGAFLALVNLTWVSMALYYSRVKN